MPLSLANGPEIVAIPGPSIVPERVLNAMRRPMPDIYSGELLGLTDEVFDALPGLARTASRGFVTISNGHGAWEMALTNTLSRGQKVLVLETGLFAGVWGDMASFDGLDVELIHADRAAAIDPAIVADRLGRDTERAIAAVLMVHVDTSSSVRNDVAAIRRALDEADHPALLMVDCIASLACERYEMDGWGVDVTVAASQKGMMTPPGLGLVWAGERALAAYECADLRTKYWDWGSRSESGPHYLRYCGTPPISLLFGLGEAIRMIDEEGLDARWARHTALASGVRGAVDAWSTHDGVRLHVPVEADRANSVTTVRTGSIDAENVASICREQLGVTLGIGVGDLPGRSFRIAHMGHVNAPTVLGVLGAVESALVSMDAPLGGSGVAVAARRLGSALSSGTGEGAGIRVASRRFPTA